MGQKSGSMPAYLAVWLCHISQYRGISLAFLACPIARGFVYDKTRLFSVYSLLILHAQFKYIYINTLQKVTC